MKLWTLIVPLVGAALAAQSWAQTLKPGDLSAPPPQPGQLGPAPEKPSAAKESINIEAAPTDSTVIRTTVRNVVVPTSVYDPRRKGFVNGLQREDFELLDNNKPQKVSGEVTEVPVSVVMLVQANSDVEPLVPELQRAGILLHGLVTGQEGDAAIVAFDYRKTVLQDFTNDAQKLDDAMHNLRTGSSTAAINDAVLYADDMLKRHDPQGTRRRVILLLSRGNDKGSETKLEASLHQIQFDNVIVYCVDMSKWKTGFFKKPDYPRPPNGGVPPEALPDIRGQIQTGTDVAQQQNGNWLNAVPAAATGIANMLRKTPAEAFSYFTGGEVFSFSNMKSLENALSAVGADLNSQYVLSYNPNDKTEPGFHTIKVIVNRPGLEVRTRPGYWWGGGQQQ